ncbi:MAG: 16S rRNA (guanine(966)-N(2))-methyltransferase RsmD [Alphaproteobacteria bacterium]|uniref:16S rRNA (Guanine(966)-N(2))-methyltransferase RsmD n=1 Tax=Candidatus Nitrobium versatile TaxID=2884831 RepID=A0A953J7B3_9BACT|nr:16S rRNA (guanine(966)-N(2))-methyltransferase RsmD [Candidatus Nitrobium versatile]
MRISGGSAKGRKVGSRKAFLRKGEDAGLRPTSAKVREAIFNILAPRIGGAVFLDLYAGTGAVGIEALSRGAERALFVENSSVRVNLIKDLVERFGFRERASVVKESAPLFLKKTEERFDIIFVDPPYESGELETVLPLIAGRELLREGGVVVAEHPSRRVPPAEIGTLERVKEYRYGDTSLSLYRYMQV